MVERVVSTTDGKAIRAYRTAVQPVNEKAITSIQSSPQAEAWGARAAQTELVEVPSVDNLWTASNYFNPLNIIRFIRRENQIDRFKESLPITERIAHEFVIASQNPELNPAIAGLTDRI